MYEGLITGGLSQAAAFAIETQDAQRERLPSLALESLWKALAGSSLPQPVQGFFNASCTSR